MFAGLRLVKHVLKEHLRLEEEEVREYRFKLNDISSFECPRIGGDLPDYVDLAYYNFVVYGKTWYQCVFGNQLQIASQQPHLKKSIHWS
jgi:hypothetical protein